jgi:competence protein CoiA
MPLTAILNDATLLDSTCLDDQTWATIHNVRPRPDLSCRDCHSRMHAKASPTGLRFFAHDQQVAHCASLGETPEHRQLKRMFADMIRDLGCTAEIEATPAAGDTGGWRADVLGTSPAGVRVAFEVQLAAMTLEEGQGRTSRYAADGIACLWVSTRHAPWLTGIPSCHLLLDGNEYVADRGLARFQQDRWTAAGTVPLCKVVLGLLKADIVAVAGGSFHEEAAGRFYSTRPSCLLVSKADAARFEQYEHNARRTREATERDRAEHRANLRALTERQDRVLQHALRTLLATGVEPSQIRLGVPASPWNGTLPAPWLLATGNEKTARGLAIWVQQEQRDQLWAVICPVAGQAGPGLGDSWSRRHVQVFVETDHEAARVSQALGWPKSAILRTLYADCDVSGQG